MAPAGRPKIGKEKRRRVNLMVDPNTFDYLKLVGDGSASNGIYLIVIHSMAARIYEEVKKMPVPKAMNRLYKQDHRKFFDEIEASEKEKPVEGAYAGFRAWSDGFQAGRASVKRKS